MMKHLPGDGVQKGSGVLVKAKEEILNDWKKAVAKTEKKPAQEKTNNKAVVKDAYLDLKKLMRELDTLYQNYNFSKMNFDKVPIYTAANNNDKEIARHSLPELQLQQDEL